MSVASTPSVRLILNTAFILTGLGMVVRASSALKEIVFASAFGVSAETDAFVLALTYSTFLPAVLGSSLATALIARLARAHVTSASRGPNPYWIVAAGGLCACLMYSLAPVLIPALFKASGNTLPLAVHYAQILAPLGFTMVLSATMDGLLNSHKQFYVAGITALATPVFTAVAVLAFAEQGGVEVAAWGMVAGGLVEVVVLVTRIYIQRARFFPSHGPASSSEQWTFWRAVSVLAFASAIASVSPLIDQVFLSRLDTGAITSLNYASKVNSLLTGLFGTAFGAAIYPYLSDLAAQRDLTGLKRLSWKLSAVVLPITAVASLIVFVFSYEIVDLLFARGNFGQKAVNEVGAIQRIFAFDLVFYVAGLLAIRVLNAAGAARFILILSCISVTANATFDWLLYERFGASGIALATVLTSMVGLVAALAFIRPALLAGR